MANVTSEPYGAPAGSVAMVHSVPVGMLAARVRARSPWVGVGTSVS